jgi:lipid A 3-O-deacylase
VKKFWRQKFLGATLLACALPAQALDGVSAELGAGQHEVWMWRVGVQWDQRVQRLEQTHWHIHWDFALGQWKSTSGTMHDLSITPVLRWAPGDRGAYLEGGIGLHLLTDSHISSDLDFSTRLQFGDHLGLGYRFSRYDLSLRLQHISNGGMRNPNPGINFVALRLMRWLGG